VKKLRIEVEEYHIQCGIPKTAECCPLAYAIGPRTGGHVEITSDGWAQLYEFDWKTWTPPWPGHPVLRQYKSDRLAFEIQLPPEAVQWMKDLDDGKSVKPFGFDLEVPEELLTKKWNERKGNRGPDIGPVF